MIKVHDLTFCYDSHAPIFESFNWEADKDEAWAIIGPSGCGKTTLLYLLAGLRRAREGQISVAGQPITRPRPETGLILQDHGLLPWATVEENVRLGLDIRRFYGPDGRHAPRDRRLKRPEEKASVSHWLDRLGISALRDKYPAQLSGGQRQRVAIARTLVLGPDLLLMDEPFSALDVPTREDLQNLTAQLRLEARLTSVIVTHNIEEAVFLGEHILVLTKPPNREAALIHNPAARQPDFRASEIFGKQSSRVREVLGGFA